MCNIHIVGMIQELEEAWGKLANFWYGFKKGTEVLYGFNAWPGELLNEFVILWENIWYHIWFMGILCVQKIFLNCPIFQKKPEAEITPWKGRENSWTFTLHTILYFKGFLDQNLCYPKGFWINQHHVQHQFTRRCWEHGQWCAQARGLCHTTGWG